jgi:hypothetical protein
MEWLALVLWLLVAGLATVLMLLGMLSIAVHAGAVVTATIAWAVFCAGGPDELAWVAVGLAVVGLIAMGFASAAIVSGEPRAAQFVSQGAEEHLAGVAGIQVGLVAAVAAVSAGAAAGLTAGVWNLI